MSKTIRTVVHIKQLSIHLKFNSEVSFVIKNQFAQKLGQIDKTYPLKKTQTTINEVIYFELPLEKMLNTHHKLKLIVNMISANGIVPAGYVIFKPNPLREGEKTQEISSLTRCSDKNSQIKFIHMYEDCDKISIENSYVRQMTDQQYTKSFGHRSSGFLQSKLIKSSSGLSTLSSNFISETKNKTKQKNHACLTQRQFHESITDDKQVYRKQLQFYSQNYKQLQEQHQQVEQQNLWLRKRIQILEKQLKSKEQIQNYLVAQQRQSADLRRLLQTQRQQTYIFQFKSEQLWLELQDLRYRMGINKAENEQEVNTSYSFQDHISYSNEISQDISQTQAQSRLKMQYKGKLQNLQNILKKYKAQILKHNQKLYSQLKLSSQKIEELKVQNSYLKNTQCVMKNKKTFQKVNESNTISLISSCLDCMLNEVLTIYHKNSQEEQPLVSQFYLVKCQ